jgi:hypothetical protein
MDFYRLEDLPDEYDFEVANIIIQLHLRKTKEEIYDLVFLEIKRWFEGIPILKVDFWNCLLIYFNGLRKSLCQKCK